MKQSDKDILEGLSHVSTATLVRALELRDGHEPNLNTFKIPGYIDNQLRIGEGEFMNIPAKNYSRVRVVLLREYLDE